MRVEKMTITPEIAGKFLAKNEGNRKLRTNAVGQIAKDIREGRWCLNGDTICLDHEGYVLDGQHRLAAIVLSGTPVETLVAFDVDRAAAITIDTGMRRTESDSIRISKMSGGIYTDNSCISLAKKLMQIQDGFVFKHQAKYSASKVYEYMIDHDPIIKFAYNNVFQAGKSYLRTTSFVVALLYVISCDVPVSVVKDFCNTIFHNSVYPEYNVKPALNLKDWYQTAGRELRASVRDEEVIRRTKAAIYCYVNNKQKTNIDPYTDLDIEKAKTIIEEN